MKRLLLLSSLIPVVAATAVAGIVSSPSKVRPCAVQYSKGITGYPSHMILAKNGDIYAGEELNAKILQFDPDTHAAKEFPVPINPHDITQGPGGRIWFVYAPANLAHKDKGGPKLGALDPMTGKSTLYPGISRNAEPHMIRWDRGRAYITEQAAGKLAIFDPKTKKIVEGRFGLPPGNGIHNITLLPNGDFWAVLQQADKLARFNFAKQRFDRFVTVPVKNGGPRDITYVPSRNALYATLFAGNDLVEYDLGTGKLSVFRSHFDPITYQQALHSRKVAKLGFVRADAKQDAVWIATLSGGEVIRFDLKTRKMTRVGCGLTEPTTTLGIVSDGKGRLWIGELFPKGRLVRIEQ